MTAPAPHFPRFSVDWLLAGYRVLVKRALKPWAKHLEGTEWLSQVGVAFNFHRAELREQVAIWRDIAKEKWNSGAAWDIDNMADASLMFAQAHFLEATINATEGVIVVSPSDVERMAERKAQEGMIE